jgi:hypothetical protein
MAIELQEALGLMRRALELLDTDNELAAAPHLDLAIVRLEDALQISAASSDEASAPFY